MHVFGRPHAHSKRLSGIRDKSKVIENLQEDQRRETALVVHDDLGFALWVGQLLGQVGLNAVPALSCQQALRFINEFNLIPDVIVVNLGLFGVPDLIQTLRGINPRLKVIEAPTPH